MLHSLTIFTVLNGYSAYLTGAALAHVLASSEVEFVEADGIASINHEINEEENESAAISVEHDLTSGAEVDIYGIDTQIYTAHTCFGRHATWGAVSSFHIIPSLTLICLRPRFLIRRLVITPPKTVMVMASIPPAQQSANLWCSYLCQNNRSQSPV